MRPSTSNHGPNNKITIMGGSLRLKPTHLTPYVVFSTSFRILQEMEAVLWKAVRNVHYMIDKEIAAGALTLLTSILLYPKTLGGGAVFSGCVPLSSSIMEQATPNVKGTPIPWLHGMADRTVLFEAGQTEPHFLEQAGISSGFKMLYLYLSIFCLLSFNAWKLCFWSGITQAYPGLGQSISNEELKYLESWIKEWFFIEFWMLLDLHKCTEMGLGPLGEPRHMYGGNKSSDIMHVVVK
ncbi:hypothetical protein OIU78_000029 [Salix suchowensis]|nr:hypothetical protein OIU78_000029 [Salix suchowensis]